MNSDNSLALEAAQLVAITALEAAETMPVAKRIMIQQGIMNLFPEGSKIWEQAKQTSEALLSYQQSQLKLNQLLEN
ncbi:hypothetical protein ACFPK9_01110 [Rubritalea spongiae]|uniref:Uncharacterized protein n=1 Tax=Rubritalea spongiae TaxID=430797 RepID=A0ABW5E0P5_9BACT